MGNGILDTNSRTSIFWNVQKQLSTAGIDAKCIFFLHHGLDIFVTLHIILHWWILLRFHLGNHMGNRLCCENGVFKKPSSLCTCDCVDICTVSQIDTSGRIVSQFL